LLLFEASRRDPRGVPGRIGSHDPALYITNSSKGNQRPRGGNGRHPFATAV